MPRKFKEVFMTKTKSNNLAKGESDKIGDKCRQIGLMPLSIDAIPSVKILQKCGKTNLERLLTALNNALRSDVTMCQECDGLCKASCHEKKAPTLQVLQKYLVNLQVAFRQADSDFPLLPDLRDEGWLCLDDSVSAYSVCDSAGEGKRLERTVAINPTLVVGMGKAGTHVHEVQFDVDDPNCPEWSAHGSSTFDLHSPYIMTGDEETFFIAHPDALRLWLSMCGNLYPEYAVYDDVKVLFANKIRELSENQIAV